MLTVKDILMGKITLDSECIDRVYLNGYVPHLQMAGGLIRFIREQMGYPIPSPMLLPPVTQAFRKAVEQYAQDQGLVIVDFGKAKDEDKDDLARIHLAQFTHKQGVVLIGKAQEKALGYKGQRKDHGTKVWFEYSRQSLYVTYYYFYILDADFGLFFIKLDFGKLSTLTTCDTKNRAVFLRRHSTSTDTETGIAAWTATRHPRAVPPVWERDRPDGRQVAARAGFKNRFKTEHTEPACNAASATALTNPVRCSC